MCDLRKSVHERCRLFLFLLLHYGLHLHVHVPFAVYSHVAFAVYSHVYDGMLYASH